MCPPFVGQSCRKWVKSVIQAQCRLRGSFSCRTRSLLLGLSVLKWKSLLGSWTTVSAAQPPSTHFLQSGAAAATSPGMGIVLPLRRQGWLLCSLLPLHLPSARPPPPPPPSACLSICSHPHSSHADRDFLPWTPQKPFTCAGKTGSSWVFWCTFSPIYNKIRSIIIP